MPPPKQSVEKPADQNAHAQGNLVCEVCGAFGAIDFEGRCLCESCYTGCGSCCPEFGKDDLWAEREGG